MYAVRVSLDAFKYVLFANISFFFTLLYIMFSRSLYQRLSTAARSRQHQQQYRFNSSTSNTQGKSGNNTSFLIALAVAAGAFYYYKRDDGKGNYCSYYRGIIVSDLYV